MQQIPENILLLAQSLCKLHNMQNVEEVIWTDGPSSEFKNRFMAALLKELSGKYNKTFTWKYFATSHGK